MHNDIAIGVAGHMFALPEDQSLDIEEQNPMFHDVEMHSYPVELPFDNNRAVFGNIDDVNSSLRAVDVEGQTARIFVSGLPIRSSVLHVQEDAVLEDRIPVNFDSRTRSFKDMISDMKCREVKQKNKIQIGEKIGQIYFAYHYTYKYYIFGSGGYGQGAPALISPPYTGSGDKQFTPPVLGFSYPGIMMNELPEPVPQEVREYTNPDWKVKIPKVSESFINVSQPYPEKMYCNSRVCYTHHDYDTDKEGTSDNVVSAEKAKFVYEDYGPYWVLDAYRPASGICFYIGYFLECLFDHLGVAYDISALTDIEDFKYMAFFTTACKCDEETKTGRGSYLPSMENINKWLDQRGCGGQVEFDTENLDRWVSLTEITTKIDDPDWGDQEWHFKVGEIPRSGWSRITSIQRKLEFTIDTTTANVSNIYANSDNFPDATVSEVIESLENTFGCRFYYDTEINKVTVYLLRDVFRSQKKPIHLNGHVNTIYKMTEKITGVKVMYSSESDAKEQRQNIREGKRDYDTDYDYIEYPDGRTIIQDYKQTVSKIDATDMNVYVDPATGNAYRIKVDKDATTLGEMKPVAFEVGAFKGVEIGDCSEENKDYVEEIISDFQPITVNDVNFRNGGTTKPDYQPLLVPFIDEDMEREFVEFKLQNAFIVEDAELYLTYVMHLAESYDPSDTDDGSSPLMNHDWGLSVGILRTGDGGKGVENYDPDYDGFGNWKWRDIADNYCMSSDTMDQLGTWLGKTSQANTFSLKIRAWKPFLYYIDAQEKMHITPYDRELEGKSVSQGSQYTWLLPCENDERDLQTGMITKRIRSRGLADVFLAEYIRFLLDRHKYKIKADVEVAQLADIPKHWCDRYEIDGKIGYIDKLHYSIDAQTGVGEVEMDFYAI